MRTILSRGTRCVSSLRISSWASSYGLSRNMKRGLLFVCERGADVVARDALNPWVRIWRATKRFKKWLRQARVAKGKFVRTKA